MNNPPIKDQLNQNPAFQWGVTLFIICIGIYLIKLGVGGIRTGHLIGKNGRVYTGDSAKRMGVFYVVIGVLFSGISLYVRLFGPLF